MDLLELNPLALSASEFASEPVSKIEIPIDEIFKIHLLNSQGKVQSVCVFCAKSKNTDDLPELFSEIELAIFKADNVEITFSDHLIHKDDSIRIIKKKIVSALGKGTISYDELYLFSFFSVLVNMKSIYQNITKNETIDLTRELFAQLAINLNIDWENVSNIDSTKTVFTYDDLLLLNPSNNELIVQLPIGMKFQEYHDYLFSVDPFHIISSNTSPFSVSSKNLLILFENNLLLNSISTINSQNIYVCLASDVFDFAINQMIDQEYICEIYYPFLKKRGITNIDKLNAMKHVLAEETSKILDTATLRLYDTVDTMYKIYWGRTKELVFGERGIRSYSITLDGGELNHSIPLDSIFKNIHSEKHTPFIKYNPGNRRENMYRLYSERVSTNGKKIPVLSESIIMKLSREIGKGHQIAIYLQHKYQERNYEIFISLNAKGQIQIYGELSIVMMANELEHVLIDAVNPVISQMNGFLQTSGYSLPTFKSLNDVNVELSNYKYIASFVIDKDVSLKKYMGCITSVFDVISDDISEVAALRFKRVENFKEMDAQAALITEVYQSTSSHQAVINALMENYSMSENEAKTLFAAFSDEHQQLNGKILENPGFPTKMSVRKNTKELVVEISEIVSAKYIDILHMYIDCILRLSQDSKSTSVSVDKIKQICGKNKKIGENADKSHVENIVIPIGMQPTAQLYKIQPLRFNIDANLEKGEEGEGEGARDDEEDDGFMFDDYDEYQEGEEGEGEEGEDKEIDGGENTPEVLENDETKYEVKLDGMSIKNPNPFVQRMLDRDPTLFVAEEQPGFPLYSTACPATDRRQPVILTDAEKTKIDETNPNSYDNAVKYGSDPNKPFWYICPRYWCLKTNSSISEEDVKAGKCGKIIPRGEKTVPRGAYVYEFADKSGAHHPTPGFLKDGNKKHPNGLCIPCCFKKPFGAKQNMDAREQCRQDDKAKQEIVGTQKNVSYIISAVSYPIPVKRWGFLPMSLQLFLQTDNSATVSKNNPAIIRPNTPCLLRYGVEQSLNQSFLGCIADLYGYKQATNVPSVKDMREILASSISLDSFLKYQNGSLPAVFRPKMFDQANIDIDKYKEEDIVKNVSDSHIELLEETIAAYENFLQFLRDENSIIDHTYLWDIVIDANVKLMKDGINLVIMDIADNDITNNIRMICPTNSFSPILYDPRKETVILLKHEQYYEPIYLYEEQTTGVVIKKTFIERTTMQSIKNMLTLIQNATKKYCSPQASLPKVYKFRKNNVLSESIRILKTSHYRVISQVLNYNGKVIGICVNREDEQDTVFVPCFPSGKIERLKVAYMDDDDLWIDYRTTRDRLIGIHTETGGKIPCKPTMKILEDGLVVGIMTETNQFVQIDPPSENIDEDGLIIIKHSNYNIADKKLMMSKVEDIERVKTIRMITMENQFYNVFRSTIRLLINKYDNRNELRKMQSILDDKQSLYKQKLKQIENILRKITQTSIAFQDFSEKTLESFGDIVACNQSEDGSCASSQQKYCLTTGDGECKTIFPKNHLISGLKNDTIYFGRMADELVRYQRIRLFMFQPKYYLNLSNTEFNIRGNELFLLQSLLSSEYFRDLVPYNVNKYIQNINYDSASPNISQPYSNEIPLTEQIALTNALVVKTQLNDYILDCIKETKPRVIGNEKAGSWRPSFPTTAKEMVFTTTIVCSYIPMIYILQLHLKTPISIQNIKTTLINGYNSLIELNGDKIIAILRKQGKRELMDSIKSRSVNLETIISSDSYYITDLDWWVLCKQNKLPVVMFSSTTLKYLNLNVDWLRLGGSGRADEKYYFVRSPSLIDLNTPPEYHLITPTFAFSEMKTDSFINAERGSLEFAQNMQSIDNYFAKYVLIPKK